MLRKKSDVLQAFKDYKRKVEKQTGQQIKILRSDNGGEYLSNEFSDFLKQEGICHQLTVEYTPQQNGVAERANRTLVEMARCLLLQAKLPDSLWAEMVNTATYIRNRCLTRSLADGTPYEAWTQKKPYVGYFRTIGIKTIALNKGQRRGKFHPKGEEYILVGYSNESKAYRLWKPGTKTIMKSRDVKLFEQIELPQTSNKEVFIAPIFPNLISNEELISDEEFEDAINSDNDYHEVESNQHEENLQNERKRGPGRPKSERTGQRGRPRKVYQTKKTQQLDPVSVSEVLESDDQEL